VYSPIYSYNNNILNNISGIEFGRGIIIQAWIIPELDSTLKKKAIIRSAHASTAIEGNTLTTNEVSKLLNGLEVIAQMKEKQEVINYSNVLKNIDKYHDNGKITVEMLLKMHGEITKDVLDDPSYEGRYRDVEVRVENLRTHKIRFMPPSYLHIPRLMDDLLSWINNSNDISPILVAGILHYEFVRIHPFIDGNGRTARALATLILNIRGYDIKKYFTLDDYYDKDRKAYVDALKSADDSFDLTHWLEYFTEGFLVSVSKVKDEVVKLLNITPPPNEIDKQLILKDSQLQIINYIQEVGKITNKQAREMLGISAQATHKNLKKLQDLSIITSKGSGRSTFYTLNRVDEKLRKGLMKDL
jgi:cell filamentation protein, protein adenylyltransferase